MHPTTSFSALARLACLPLSLLLLFACENEDPTGPAPVASQLAFLTEPTSVEAGAAIDPAVTVELQDESGQRVDDAEVPVTLSLGQAPDGASLSGTKTVRSVGGVASFSGLSVDSAAGGYRLTAQASNLAAAESAPFEVVAGPPASVAVSPSPARLNAIGDTLQLTASVRDRVGNQLPEADLTWSSADPDVAAVDASGRAVAAAEGETTITAEGGGTEGEIGLEVDQIAATVTLSPSADTLAEGETVELQALAADSNGVEMSAAAVTWVSEAPAVAAVTATGGGTAEVEALRGGPTLITASADGQSAAAEIHVLRKIAFVSYRDGIGTIYAINSDGTEPTRLMNNSSLIGAAPAWSPDGEQIAFWSTEDGIDSDLYVMNWDGSGQTRLTSNSGYNVEHAWSPDGQKIVFRSNNGNEGDDAIYVMDADGSGRTRLTHINSNDAPSWSPDGEKIVFVRYDAGNADIFVMNADGSGEMNLTNDDLPSLQPVWSPDGSKIAFRCSRNSTSEICVMNADGSGQANLTSNSGTDLSPSWSPDGSKIAFRSSRDGTYELYVMNSDGTEQTRLTNSGSIGFSPPRWSPDGSRIAIAGSPDGSSEIYLVNADGSGQTNITNNPAYDASPAWRPDPQP